MASIIKYAVIYPIVFVDVCLDLLLVQSKRIAKFKYLPKPNDVHSVKFNSSHSSISYRAVRNKELFRLKDEKTTLYDSIAHTAKKMANSKILGHREILFIEEQPQSDGKLIKKFNMTNDYSWITYKELITRIDHLANGLLNIGLKSNDNIVLFSETRPEWLIFAVACFKINVPIVTLYSTLGLEALAFGINQTKATYIITSGDGALKLQKVLSKVNQLTHIIVIPDKFTEKNSVDLLQRSNKNLNVFTMAELEKIGESTKTNVDYEKPKIDDLAIIMYTSGSTGTPKGVMMSHRNLLTSVRSLVQRFDQLSDDEVFIAYLPLAHVLELSAEIAWLIHGIRIGYSSAFTLTDNSSAIKAGQLGDIRILRPTFMFSVPVVLELIKKAVEERINKQNALLKNLFRIAYEQKLSKIKSGLSSTLLDKLVFNKLKQMFGGRLDKILIGGSMLNKDVHEFAQVCICTVVQAYGLTETCAASTTQFANETTTKQVGSVVECCEIKLVDWPEGNYRCIDKPNPRGEIFVSGDNVTMGYFNMPEKTREDYRVINGVRYFATGDIGEMTPEGNLIIIDRKKDLVKLQGGEYVSLNKVETIVKLMPMVDNCCVIANPSKSYCICLITPNLKRLREFLNSNITDDNNNSVESSKISDQKENHNDLIDFYENKLTFVDNFNKELLAHCLKQGLERFEIPTKVKLVKETWLPDSGLVTDSFKLKRKEINALYFNQIQTIYI